MNDESLLVCNESTTIGFYRMPFMFCCLVPVVIVVIINL
jgi:hypothetical protein